MSHSSAFEQRRHVLSHRDLLEIEGSTARSVETLQAMVGDRSITAADRALAREALAAAESNLIKVRRILGIPAVGDVR